MVGSDRRFWPLWIVAWLALAGPNNFARQDTKEVGVDGLIYDLGHPDEDRRKKAAVLLGQHRVREAVPALIESAKDPNYLVRLESARALARIGDPRALASFIRLTDDSKKAIQEKAIEGIIKVYVVEKGGFVHGLKKFIETVNPLDDDYNPLVVEPYVAVSPEAVKALANLLQASDNGIRKDAAIGLGILRASLVLEEIKRALSGETDTAVKVELIRAIYKVGDPRAGDSVIPMIRDADKEVRDEAIFTLGRLRVRGAVSELRELYQSGIQERKKIFGVFPVSGSDDLQKRLLEALSYIADPSCEHIFLDALEDERDSYRRYGAEGLGRLGDKSRRRMVGEKYLREKSQSVRLALSFALFRLGRDEHLVEVIDHLNDTEQVSHYLLEMGPEETMTLYPHVRTENFSIRIRLIEIIGLRADQSALKLLEETSQNPNPQVASAANLAIRRIRGRYNFLYSVSAKSDGSP